MGSERVNRKFSGGSFGSYGSFFIVISTKAPQVVGLAQFQGTALWEASLWAKGFRRPVAERARLPQGAAM